MGRSEKVKNLAGDIPAELHEAIVQWVNDHKDVKLRQCIEAMAELWLQLPRRIQALLLFSRRDSTEFAWATDEVRERCLPYEDLFNIQSSNAPRVVRRVLLLLKDYAQTRVGIQTHEDLTNALDAIHDLVQWLGDDFLATIPGDDRFAVQQIKAVLDRRAGVDVIGQPAPQARDYIDALKSIASQVNESEYRQMSPDEQHLIDQIRSQPQAKQRERTRISTEEDARARQAAKKADRIVRGAEADASTQRKSMRHSAG